MPETTNLPYVVGTGSLVKALVKIQSAATPDRFTQDFLATKLGLKGGAAKAVLPFLKRAGMLASDGAPTELYRRFRNTQQRGAAAAEALRIAYQPLYEANEYAHDLEDDELRGLIVQLTGVDENSRVLTATVASFKALREHATFDSELDDADEPEDQDFENQREEVEADRHAGEGVTGLNIGYTINLHLPATSDIAVFNAIFKSLRENLLR